MQKFGYEPCVLRIMGGGNARGYRALHGRGDIMGRGDEEELKHRVFWYITFHPAVFQACFGRAV